MDFDLWIYALSEDDKLNFVNQLSGCKGYSAYACEQFYDDPQENKDQKIFCYRQCIDIGNYYG